MDDVILNKKYKYVYDSEKNFWRIHINGTPVPFQPEKTFKFYSANLNNVASLHENYFWLSNPKDFNDPFDCNLNLIEHENDVIKSMDVRKKRNDISNIGVTCFTEVINEPLLWAHYTNNYLGFAIEFNSKSITVQLDKNERKCTFNPVLYFDEFIKVKNTDDFALEYLLTAKSEKWSYEKEWRFIASVDDKIPYNRIIYYETCAVKAIYIGHRLFEEQDSVFKLIDSLFMTKYPDKPVYNVYPHPYKLELNFQRQHEN